MAEKIVSPGVFTKEIDQTFLPSAIQNIGAVVVGPTVKGPAFTPTVVNSYGDFQAKFGDIFISGSNYYQYLTSMISQNYFKNGGPLTVCRVLAGSYTRASSTISSSIDPSFVGGGIQATGSITIAGTLSAINEESCSIGGVYFAFSGSNNSLADTATLLWVATGSTTTTAATAFKDVINTSQSLHNLAITASSLGALVGLTSSYAGRIHGNDGGSLMGGSQISGTLNIVSSSKTAFTPVQEIQGGRESQSEVFKESFKLHTLSHGDVLNNTGTIRGKNLLANGTLNNIRWEVSSLNKNKGTFSLLIRRGNDIENRKAVLESWNELSLDPNSNNYIEKRIGNQVLNFEGSGTNDPYLQPSGSHLNNSKYVRAEVISRTLDYLDANGNIDNGNYSASLPSFASGSNSGSFGGSFSGGSDGTVVNPKNFFENITAANTQGLDCSVSGVGKDAYIDALNLLKNQDEYDFNLLLLPGLFNSIHSSIITKAIDVCEDRGDCFVIVDPVLKEKSISEATNESKGRDTNYAAMYWPWVQVSDNQLNVLRWVPPSTVVAGMYAFNDKVGHPWTAPAGLNRGTLDTVRQAERKLTHPNRDELYERNINPLATFPGQGVTVWGQKTLQKKSSALDRVNVRRLLITVKKFIASTSRFLLFEQNNVSTRGRFISIVNPYMEQIKANSGLHEFRVIMDSTNNTQDIIDRNILYGQIFVQPTRTAEFIVLDFTVQPTGATFPE